MLSGSNQLFIHNAEAPFTSSATEYYKRNISGSLIYGTFPTHPSGSTIRINGQLQVEDKVTFESSSFTNEIYNTGSLINSGSVSITGSLQLVSGSIQVTGSLSAASISAPSLVGIVRLQLGVNTNKPTVTGGSAYLAVSGSNLIFFNGSTWTTIV